MRISDWSSDVCSSDLMSPAAALAFDEAVKRDPAHPAAPFFAGLAMAQGGDLKGANAVWSDLLARSPANAPWRADLEMRLAQIRRAMGPALPAHTPAGPWDRKSAAEGKGVSVRVDLGCRRGN